VKCIEEARYQSEARKEGEKGSEGGRKERGSIGRAAGRHRKATRSLFGGWVGGDGFVRSLARRRCVGSGGRGRASVAGEADFPTYWCGESWLLIFLVGVGSS